MILSGAVASSAGGLIATGGSTTFDANGYRHHVFLSSGTLTVSGAGVAKVISQFGGAAGGNWSSTSNTALSGAGGSSGVTQYYDATVTGNVTVTVGAAGSASSTTGALTAGTVTQPATRAGGTSWRAAHAGDVCSQTCYDFNYGYIYCCGYSKVWALNQTATVGAAGAEHSTVSSVYSGQGFQFTTYTTNAGGGGGAGGLQFYNTSGQVQQANHTSGGVTGGGQGGNLANGTAGGTNTGGGGGGGQGYAYPSGGAGGTSGGPGGSGYVIISYPI